MAPGTEDHGSGTEPIKINPELIKGAIPAHDQRVPKVHVPALRLSRIGTQIDQWVEDALIQCAAGDRFSWDVGLVTIPSMQPSGQIGISTAYAFILYLAHPVLNAQPFGLARIWTDNPPRDGIEQAVRAAVEELRSLRSAELQMRNHQPPMP